MSCLYWDGLLSVSQYRSGSTSTSTWVHLDVVWLRLADYERREDALPVGLREMARFE
jgi:hypothetical protein